MGWRYIFAWKKFVELLVISLDAIKIVSGEEVFPVEHQGMMCVRQQTMPQRFTADAIADCQRIRILEEVAVKLKQVASRSIETNSLTMLFQIFIFLKK